MLCFILGNSPSCLDLFVTDNSVTSKICFFFFLFIECSNEEYYSKVLSYEVINNEFF